MNLMIFRVSSIMRYILYCQSRTFILMSIKVSEMKFSDRVDNKNVQVYCPTPSKLRDRTL